MKIILKLAVLLAVLLLLTGVSSAQPAGYCTCYEITATNLDDSSLNDHGFMELCLDYENKSGTIENLCSSMDLSLFFGPLGIQALGYGKGCVGFFKFHGSDKNVVTIIFYDGYRYTIWGHKTDWVNCEL